MSCHCENWSQRATSISKDLPLHGSTSFWSQGGCHDSAQVLCFILETVDVALICSSHDVEDVLILHRLQEVGFPQRQGQNLVRHDSRDHKKKQKETTHT